MVQVYNVAVITGIDCTYTIVYFSILLHWLMCEGETSCHFRRLVLCYAVMYFMFVLQYISTL
jgi:hypothetical protein